jgi:hypothetical protein
MKTKQISQSIFAGGSLYKSADNFICVYIHLWYEPRPMLDGSGVKTMPGQ